MTTAGALGRVKTSYTYTCILVACAKHLGRAWVRGEMWGKALLLATQALGRWDCGKHETCRAPFLEHSCILGDYQGKLSTSNMLRRQTWIRSLGKKAFSQQKEESKWRRSWMKTNSDLVGFFCVLSCMNCMNDNFARRPLLRYLWWCNLHHVLGHIDGSTQCHYLSIWLVFSSVDSQWNLWSRSDYIEQRVKHPGLCAETQTNLLAISDVEYLKVAWRRSPDAHSAGCGTVAALGFRIWGSSW